MVCFCAVLQLTNVREDRDEIPSLCVRKRERVCAKERESVCVSILSRIEMKYHRSPAAMCRIDLQTFRCPPDPACHLIYKYDVIYRYTCIYIYIYVYIHTYIYTHKNVYRYINIDI